MKDKKRLNWNFQKWKYNVWNETNILEGIDSRLEAVEENVVKLEDNKSSSPNEVHRKNKKDWKILVSVACRIISYGLNDM